MDDFNARAYTEAGYVNSPVINANLDLFQQELIILFDTAEFEVLGNANMGLALERFLGRFSLGAPQIKNLIVKKIQDNCYMNEYFRWDVAVSFQRGTQTDIMLIDIDIRSLNDNSPLKKQSFIYR